MTSDITTPKSGRLSSKFTHSADFPLKEPLGLLSFNDSDARVMIFLLINASV